MNITLNTSLGQWKKQLKAHLIRQLAFRFDFTEQDLTAALDAFFLQMVEGNHSLIEQVQDFQRELAQATEALQTAERLSNDLFKQRTVHYRELQRTLKDHARELNRSFQEQIKINGKIREKAVLSATKAGNHIPNYLPHLMSNTQLMSSHLALKRTFSPFLNQLQKKVKTTDTALEEARRSYTELSNYIMALRMSPLAQYADNYGLSHQGRPVPANNVRFLSDYRSHYDLCLKARNRILQKLVDLFDPVFDRMARLPQLYDTAEASIGKFVWDEALFSRWGWMVFYEIMAYFPVFQKPDFMEIRELIYYDSALNIREDRPLHRYERRVLNSLLVTRLQQQTFFYRLPHKARQRHCFILGRTGSGKTELLKLLIHNDIRAGKGVLLIDPHGDLAEQCSRFRLWEDPRFRERLVYISGQGIYQGIMPLLNPLTHNFYEVDIHTKRQMISIRVGELMSAFEVIFRGEFTDNMRLLLDRCLRLLLVHQGTGIQDLLDMLYPFPQSSYLRRANEHYDPSVQRYFEQLFFEDRYQVTKAAILTRFETALGYEALKLLLCRSGKGVPLTPLLESGKVVIINASQGIFGELGSRILGAFLMAEVSSLALSRAKLQESQRQEVFVYLDECQNFLNEKIDKVLSEARKYGVHLTLATQHLGHFSSMLPLRRSIMANTAVKICGSVSVGDAKIMSQAIDLNLAKVDNLKAGKFALKAGEESALVIQAHSHLLGADGEHYLPQERYRQLMAEQYERYYLPAATAIINERDSSYSGTNSGTITQQIPPEEDFDFTLEDIS
ncbi:MAG: DUF87 domain-containing protein [Bacteroidota bacterium]